MSKKILIFEKEQSQKIFSCGRLQTNSASMMVILAETCEKNYQQKKKQRFFQLLMNYPLKRHNL